MPLEVWDAATISVALVCITILAAQMIPIAKSGASEPKPKLVITDNVEAVVDTMPGISNWTLHERNRMVIWLKTVTVKQAEAKPL